MIIITILIIISLYLLSWVYNYDNNYSDLKYVKNSDKRINTLMITMHPDDELLWGYKYLNQNIKVICISKASSLNRVKEFTKVMYTLKVPEYEIWDHKIITNSQGYNILKKKLEKEIVKYDRVITHNYLGEYFNLSHISLSLMVTNICNKFNKKCIHFKPIWYKYDGKKEQILKLYKSQKMIINLLRLLHRFY
jgi:hypothetical protein